jgi:hypothetical protein
MENGAKSMPKQRPTDKLASLHEKMRQLQAQAAAIEARQKEQDRKNDTRRKVIAGALALEHATANADSGFAATLNRLLNEYVKRPSDRALFPDLPEDSGNQETPTPRSEIKLSDLADPAEFAAGTAQ